jgi:hypothetical protein
MTIIDHVRSGEHPLGYSTRIHIIRQVVEITGIVDTCAALK